MSNQTPYIGSKISLISKLDIRYEGILYTVDTNDSTIALAKVRSFGTEKRPTANPVSARDDVYEYIIFKASDIKDLIVCDTPKMATIGGGLPYDPAIISVSSRSAPASNSDGGAAASAGSSRAGTPSRNSPLAHVMNPRGQGGRGGYQQDFQGGRGNFNNYRGGNASGFGGGYNQRGRNNFGVPRVNPREKLKFESDFDFEKANEKFQEVLTDNLDKLTIEEKEQPAAAADADAPAEEKKEAFYDKKSSFFDNISCESLEKAEGKTGRPDWKKERETNQETFGHNAVRSLNYRRGYGGRGRGGNRGYGGYNNGYQPRGGYNNGYRPQYNNNGGYQRRGGYQQREQQQAAPAAEQ